MKNILELKNDATDGNLQSELSDELVQICPQEVNTPPMLYATEEKFRDALDASGDKLIFIRFTPTNTLRPKWFLVQVVLPDPGEHAVSPFTYFRTFLQKHPKDNSLPDNKSRWWPE